MGGRPWPSSAETISYLLRWIIKHSGIKENILVRCAVHLQEHAHWGSENEAFPTFKSPHPRSSVRRLAAPSGLREASMLASPSWHTYFVSWDFQVG